MTRRRFTTLDKLKIAMRQATCPRCGGRLNAIEDCDVDHIHPLALGGEDEIGNAQLLHRQCHATKTNGAGGTTAGSDKNRIAKARRCAKETAESRRRLLAKDEPDIAPAPTRAKRKIPSRPFKKRKASR